MEARDKHKRSGDNGGEDPPVPISNTEVKLPSAEDTWREAAWENRTLPVLLKSKMCEHFAFLAFRGKACKTGQLKNCNAAEAAQFLYQTCALYQRYRQVLKRSPRSGRRRSV